MPYKHHGWTVRLARCLKICDRADLSPDDCRHTKEPHRKGGPRRPLTCGELEFLVTGGRTADLPALEGLGGEIMRCIQYAKTPTAKIRCATLVPGPGPADDHARDDAGVSTPYHYKTRKTRTRGRKVDPRSGFPAYPRVHIGTEGDRILPRGRNVPVAGRPPRGRRRAAAAKV